MVGQGGARCTHRLAARTPPEMPRRFIVFADSFDENNGGIIALHRLCDLLNRGGQVALLWPARKPLLRPGAAAGHAPRPGATTAAPGGGRTAPARCSTRRWRRRTTCPAPSSSTPRSCTATRCAREHVVRWLLHKPGWHKGRVDYGPGDRYFFYQKAFDDPALNPDGDNLLKTVWVRDDVYRQTHHGERRGSCYILRKGKGRTLVHDLKDSVLVDKLSHTELAKVFNRVQTCISYDAYTMYSLYAALCGCVSVVVPEPGVSKEQWYPDPKDRYGLAYGFDDIAERARDRSRCCCRT